MKAKGRELLLSVLLLTHCLLAVFIVFEQRQIVLLQQQVIDVKEIIATKEKENSLLAATRERFHVLGGMAPSSSLLDLANKLEKLVDASGGQLTAFRTTGLSREEEWQVYEQEVEIEGTAGSLAAFLEQLRRQSPALVLTSFTATPVISPDDNTSDNTAQGQNITGPLRFKAGIKYRLYLFSYTAVK